MSEPRTTYTFGPLERRGLLGPVTLGQAAVLATAILATVALLDLAPSAGGLFAGVLLLALAAGLAYAPLAGRTALEWLPLAIAFLARRGHGRGRFRSSAPAVGQVVDHAGLVTGLDDATVLEVPAALSGVTITGGSEDEQGIGILSERGGRRLTAVLACRVAAFALLDREAQERRLARWGLVLSGAGGTPVRRLQWIERTAPAQGDELARWLHDERDPSVPLRGAAMIESYLELISSSTRVSQDHEVLLAVQVDGRGVRERGRGAVSRALLEATERIAQALEGAEVTVLGALGPGQLAHTLRTAFDPYARGELATLTAGRDRTGELAQDGAWPLATREHWDHWAADGALHATFWISGWPRVEVSPMFMDALLGPSGAVRTVAVSFEPLALDRSTREVEAAVTRDRADRELRARFGQSETARQRQAAQATVRREAELAAGHGEVRLSGFITVSRARRGRSAPLVRRGAGARCAGAAAAAPPVRPAGRGVHVHAAAGPGTAMSAARPGHRSTTRHAQAVYPFVNAGGLGGRGVYIGRESGGGAFCYDPWVLYGDGALDDPNAIVLGTLGQGKSALVKTLLWRMLLFGRRAFVLDVKREYGPLCRAAGVEPISLRPGGSVRLNPLASRPEEHAQLELLRAVAMTALGGPLTQTEAGALREALRIVRARGAGVGPGARPGEPTLPEIAAVLFAPPAEMAQQLQSTPAALAADARRAALALQDLCEGPLRGMFDGPTTPGLDLDARLLVLDLHAVRDSPAVGILMACATAWISALLARTAERPGRERLVNVADESWKIVQHTGLGEWFQSNFKLARQFGVMNLVVLHKLADLQAAGDAGSRAARIAEGLVADASTRIVYHQDESQIETTRTLLGLSRSEARLLTMLSPGQALWRVGQRSFVVTHRRSRIEAQLTDTDAGMNAANAGRWR